MAQLAQPVMFNFKLLLPRGTSEGHFPFSDGEGGPNSVGGLWLGCSPVVLFEAAAEQYQQEDEEEAEGGQCQVGPD